MYPCVLLWVECCGRVIQLVNPDAGQRQGAYKEALFIDLNGDSFSVTNTDCRNRTSAWSLVLKLCRVYVYISGFPGVLRTSAE
jgi:hypothetical protein